MTTYDVYIEAGAKRAFACAVDWLGWCRHGPTERDALEALIEYGGKYRANLAGTRLGFDAPRDVGQLVIVERLAGTATTDFGAIGVIPAADQDRSCDAALLKRFETFLQAGWRAFDAAVDAARGKKLSTGPRGGGRSLDAIVKHVIEADASYLRAVGWKPSKADAVDEIAALRQEILRALKASANGEIPPTGPRGGSRWPARFFARRVAWHVYSHAWEIERRAA